MWKTQSIICYCASRHCASASLIISLPHTLLTFVMNQQEASYERPTNGGSNTLDGMCVQLEDLLARQAAVPHDARSLRAQAPAFIYCLCCVGGL